MSESRTARPYLIGLTGSVGMGKSTTAAMFAERGVPVWDADAAVHRLYGAGGAAVAPLAACCPEVLRDGQVDRDRLKAWIAEDPLALDRIESVVHPLVAQDRAAFVDRQTAPILLFDIPLLFETGATGDYDLIVVVSTTAAEQRRRVLDRPGMTSEHLDRILARQMPDAEKCRCADMVIDTTSLAAARSGVDTVLDRARRELNHA